LEGCKPLGQTRAAESKEEEKDMKTILVTVTASILAVGALAQNSEVGKRAENQQDRLAQGVRSGQLTAGETTNLEKKEASVNQEVRADRSLNGGHLTPQEKRIVNRQQNNLSGQIYKDKHNAATQHYGNNEVDQRRENQQDRIANGIASGKLSASETARLEKGQAAINHETRTDRALNGGHLTQGEKQQINRQQNRASGRIYRAKHN
jgi:hypothetical protein